MTPDKFEKVESTISGWIARHKLITFTAVGIFILILTISLFVIIFTSGVGMNAADVNITECYNAELISSDYHYVSEEEYTAWNNLVIPAYLFCLNFVESFWALIPIVYFIAMIYFIIRWGYRRRKLYQELKRK